MKLFKNKINIETGQVFSISGKKEIGSTDGDYKSCSVYDCYNNKYYHIHEVVYAEGSGLPKHLWPIDENGRRYEIDHITPKREGGTDTFSNLQLVSKKTNNDKISNEQANRLNSVLNKQVYQYTLDGKLISTFKSCRDAERKTGFANTHISACCNGAKKQHQGFRWSYKLLENDG